mmetsp:Transcript_91472/g.196111  ORF Transcript_91472/g.196111 Transcript_91472/m.196111 type:complete len:397 (-) Transcript_91472:728-1918(-)
MRLGRFHQQAERDEAEGDQQGCCCRCRCHVEQDCGIRHDRRSSDAGAEGPDGRRGQQYGQAQAHAVLIRCQAAGNLGTTNDAKHQGAHGGIWAGRAQHRRRAVDRRDPRSEEAHQLIIEARLQGFLHVSDRHHKQKQAGRPLHQQALPLSRVLWPNLPEAVLALGDRPRRVHGVVQLAAEGQGATEIVRLEDLEGPSDERPTGRSQGRWPGAACWQAEKGIQAGQLVVDLEDHSPGPWRTHGLYECALELASALACQSRTRLRIAHLEGIHDCIVAGLQPTAQDAHTLRTECLRQHRKQLWLVGHTAQQHHGVRAQAAAHDDSALALRQALSVLSRELVTSGAAGHEGLRTWCPRSHRRHRRRLLCCRLRRLLRCRLCLRPAPFEGFGKEQAQLCL